MTEADLPVDALGDFKSSDGASYLLVAYPDRGIADEAALIAFGEDMARISPSLTGSLQLGVQLGRVVVDEAWRCAILVAATVAALVLAGFRSVKLTLLSLSGLAAGMALGFGIYPLAGSYNIVNVLAVPLIIGIGIDYCIHIIHNVGRGLSVRRAMDRIGRAIILSSATTMIGFGSLALMGRYRGVASLGRLLFIGVGACLFVAMVVIPAALGFAARRAARGEVGADAGTIS
jgi:predicted RND superfamily exporter protein